MVFELFLPAFGGFAAGYILGRVYGESKLARLSEVLIPGQTVWVRGVGELRILGQSADGKFTDTIPEELVAGQQPHEWSDAFVAENTISYVTNELAVKVRRGEIVVRAAS